MFNDTRTLLLSTLGLWVAISCGSKEQTYGLAGAGSPDTAAETHIHTHTNTCTDTIYLWSDSAPSQPELHIVSVYEADGGHGGPAGNITVHIDRPGNVVLVLSSYEPVDWTVLEQAGTTIDEVILNGYHTQRLVRGASGATVLDRTYENGGNYWAGCAYAWPSSDGGCDTPGLVSAAELHSGLELTSFVGCYHGTSFSVH